MKTNILCKLFGHKLLYFTLIPNQLMCERCDFEIDIETHEYKKN